MFTIQINDQLESQLQVISIRDITTHSKYVELLISDERLKNHTVSNNHLLSMNNIYPSTVFIKSAFKLKNHILSPVVMI